MNAHSRHEQLLDVLQRRSPQSVNSLEKLLGASPATIRRDVAFLEKAGKIVRTHGSVYHPQHFQGEASYDRKSRRAVEAKARVARAAAQQVRPGMNVFVDAGTTAMELGRVLLRDEGMSGVTVFTNSIPLLAEQSVGATLVALGGEVRPVSQALTGAVALEWLRRLRFDLAFLGTSGIDAADGPTTTEVSEAAIKAGVIARAKRAIVLADAAKWDQPAAIRYADWPQIHELFTDYQPTEPEHAMLTRQGLALHTV